MGSKKKTFDDCERFLNEYFAPRAAAASPEEYSFLLGYWAHLIADAEFQRYIRDEDRVRASWLRIKTNSKWADRATGSEETWDSFKQIYPKKEQLLEIACIESEYLHAHPTSGYLTEILSLTDFPDYIDYLPPDSIARKIKIMGTLPAVCENPPPFLAFSREEYAIFIYNSAFLILRGLREKNLIP